MTPDQVSEALSHLAKVIAENTPDMTQTVAATALAVVRDRIQDTGVDSKGVKFKGYSTKEIPAFFYTGKSLKKLKKDEFGEDALQQNDMLSYKEWRELNNLQTDHVDLTFTGDMWRKTAIISAGLAPEGYVVSIGGNTREAQDKINYASDKYGNILSVSEKEEKNLTEDYDEMLDKLIAESGLG